MSWLVHIWTRERHEDKHRTNGYYNDLYDFIRCLFYYSPGTHNLNNTNRDTYTNPSHIRNRELAVLEYYDRSSSDNDSDEWSDHNDEDWEDIAPNANDPNSEPEVRRLDKVIMVDEAMEYF